MDGPDPDSPNALRALTAEERAICAPHPLPPGVMDAVVNKAQLATALDTTETTIGAWVRKGLPFEEAGTNGRSYRFRLSVAFAWVAAMRADEGRARARADAAVQQLQMALLGGETAKAVPGKMTLAEQRQIIELELQRANAARQRGELVRRDDMVMVVEEVLASIRDAFDAFPDRLARELALEGAALDHIERACDDALDAAVRAVRETLGDETDTGDDPGG